MNKRFLLSIIFLVMWAGAAQAATTSAPLTISVDGNLFLDSAIFSNRDLLEQGQLNISVGNALVIYDPNTINPYLPIFYNVYTLNDSDTTFKGTGNWLLFSNTPRSVEKFSATDNMFIGTYDYSSLPPVPVIPSGWLFFSAINIPALLKLREKILGQ